MTLTPLDAVVQDAHVAHQEYARLGLGRKLLLRMVAPGFTRAAVRAGDDAVRVLPVQRTGPRMVRASDMLGGRHR